jgi:disulfide bond formation protein DsbB
MIQEQSEADTLAFIRAGRDANDPANTTGIDMPPSGGNPSLTDEEILAIVAFLRTR